MNLLRSNLYSSLLERRIVNRIKLYVYLGVPFAFLWLALQVYALAHLPTVVAFVK